MFTSDQLKAIRQRLNALLAQLTELESQDCYGECTECGEHIAAARLEASPEVSLCIGCASAAEKT